MYTRSTPQRAQNAGQQQFQGQGQGQAFNQQQGPNAAGNPNQQGAFKQQANNATPYKQQPQQQQQTPQAQRMPNQQQQIKQESTPQRMQQVKQQQQQIPQQQQQQQTPQPQRQLKPILKSTGNVQGGATPGQAQAQAPNQFPQQNVQPNPNNGMETGEPMEGEGQDVPRWKRKIPGLKVSRKVKRLRLNQRLRRAIPPKNAVMVLNEMKTGVQFTYPESHSALPSSLFVVHAKIEGKTYIGQGLSKHLARQNAAENAFKSLLLEKMSSQSAKDPLDAESDGSVLTDGENKDGAEGMEVEENDEIPWNCLASFALYKLFLEWQNQGTVVPVPRPGLSTGRVKKEQPKPAVPKDLPPNAETVHPVMLLSQMRPGVAFTEVSRVGNPPNMIFTLSCEVDGQEFTGAAKNKKDAKKQAARNALHALYNVVYPEEKESEDVAMA